MLHRTSRIRWAQALLLFGGLLSAGSARAQVAPPQSTVVDEHLRKTWTDNKLTPAKRATDNEFMRRVFIDVLGRIPVSDEVREFERDKSPNKRAKLVHRLLTEDAYKIKDAAGREAKGDDGKPLVFEYTEEYAKHWADIWTVWLMTRGGTHEMYHSQMEYWLKTAFLKNMPHDEMTKALLTASGKSNNGVANFIMAHLGEQSPPDRRISEGPWDAIPITSRVTRLFLGIQTQCTQCHDHPFNPEWGQENFWGVNAFFRTTMRLTDDPSNMPSPPMGLGKNKKDLALKIVTVQDDPKLNDSTRIFYERRTGVLMSIKPTFLPDLSELEKDKAERAKKLLPSDGGKSRREVLADYIIKHDNFAKAYVNRIWGHFFGRGLNEQPVVDDFGGHNKVVHPELLEFLGKEFIKYKYDPKALIEWICNCEAYNLSYVAPNKDMAKPENDAYFTRMPLKAMSPEVLFESLATATRADQQVDKEARKEARRVWMNKLVRNFGDDEGNEMTFNGTIVQALLMMNGRELNDEIKRSDGFIAKTIARAAKQGGSRDQYIIDEIYLTALGRHPGTHVMDFDSIDPKTKRKVVTRMTEIQFVLSQLNAARNTVTAPNPKAKGKNPPATPAYNAFYEDLFWTLLNTSEFMLNH